MTGEGNAAAEPAQAKTLSSLAAPRPTYEEPTYQAPTREGGTGETSEAIDPATGEIIVLAQRKIGAEADAVTARSNEQVTVLAKPEKRKSAKDKAQAKFARATPASDDPARDGTTPDMTATAKSRAGIKSEDVLAANEARKQRKAASKAKAAPKAAPKTGASAGTRAKGKAGTKAKAR